MSAAEWYFLVNQTRVGPVDEAEFQRLLREGTIGAQTLVWREGLEEWEEARHHADTGAAVPPPIPSRSGYHHAPAATPGPPRRQEDAGGAAPWRGFGEAVAICLRKYVTFSGRASRSEFWFFVLFTILAGIAASLVDLLLFGPRPPDEDGPVAGAVSLLLLLPTLAATWRRLHDTGRSGWWAGVFWVGLLVAVVLVLWAARTGWPDQEQLIGLGFMGAAALVLHSLLLLLFLVQRGEPRPNRYG